MRKSANKHFGHHIKEIHQTKSNGHYDKVNMIYWDIRFSNLCNLSCRYCGTYFSSNWYDDQVAFFGKPNHPKVTYAGKSKTDAYDQLINYLPMVEQVYFAGGEPLIMEEHYKILKALIDIGKADQVRLIYNTNFTQLSYKSLNVLDLWPEFQDVSVGASLDAMGSRAELVRNGTVWKDVEKNREQMLKKCPKVDFYISATLSAFNFRHVIDFHNTWVEKGFIKWQDWNMNVVQDPEHYRADILPLSVKQSVTVEYEDHIKKIEPFDHLGRATNGFRSAVKFINATDNTKLLPQFRRYIELLDKRRQQNTLDVFPELDEVING
jgi:sulfatase maturation enzyme AslB (radical SAM superfamily)